MEPCNQRHSPWDGIVFPCLLVSKWFRVKKALHNAFKALKSSGFNIENTHLTDPDRINKLLALVLFAFTLAYLARIFLDSLRPIKIKKHGRKAKSLFKYGLTHLASVLFSNDINKFIECCNFLSCT